MLILVAAVRAQRIIVWLILKLMKNHRPVNNWLPAFSLIELVVAIGIMLVLLGGGLAAFIRFNDKQKVIDTAKEVQQLAKTAQIKARARETPTVGVNCDGSTSIVAYRVFVPAGSGATAKLLPICGNSLNNFSIPNPYNVAHVLESVELDTSVEIDPAIDLYFLTLQGGVRIDSSASTFTFSQGGQTVAFSVSTAGEISDVETVE